MRGLFISLVVILFPIQAFCEEIVNTSGNDLKSSALAIASAITIAIAALAGAFAQGRTASSALDGIARNPDAADKIQTPLIISLALIESLVIYALVIAFLLQGKI